MKDSSLTSSASISWLFKMAWRDAKASKLRLTLFMASIILGIGAVVSIQLFSANLLDNIQRQSKSLMGADFIIDSEEVPNERAQAIIDSLGPDAYEVNFVSMVAFPKSGGTKLVRVRGLEGAFPFYGAMETTPVDAVTKYQRSGGALVDATLMLQYNAQPGDSIKVGELTLPIAGALESIPGSTAISTSVAPYVVIPNRLIPQTELLQFGSRKEYQYFFNQPDTDLKALENRVEPMLDKEDADLDTHTSTSRRLGRRYENVAAYLNLAAFIALLLGCIGIASSVNIYIKEKLPAVAILKCLGASKKQSFLIFLIQIAGIGLLGGILGSLIGIGLQELFPYILKGFLPFDVVINITWPPILLGVTLGLLMSVLFAALPLLRTWYVSPLEVLRVGGSDSRKSSRVGLMVLLVIITFLYGFSVWLIDDAIKALGFILGVAVTFGILAGTAGLAMRIIKNYFPDRAGFVTRQSLLNLFRPNNQTLVLLVSIGLGTFLISTLYFTKDILLSKTEVGQEQVSANLITLDIQPEQVPPVLNTFQENRIDVVDNIPLVTMRMHRLKEELVSSLRADTTRTVRRWILNHEFRTTYRDHLIDSEELLQGKWVENYQGSGAIPISISDNLAQDAQLGIGAPVIFNVQGVLMETFVQSIRKVDWARAQLNFSIVFPKGSLENAPQFNVVTAYAPDEESSAAIQQDLVSQFPNISIIDLRQVLSVVADILDKVSWIVNFMAFFSILTGIIVLIGSVRTSKYQRIKESVLLRTLGAKNKQILKISALEYLFLGLLGSLVGIVLALLSSLMLALFIFEEPFVPSIWPFLIFIPGISLLVIIIGLSNIQSVLKSSPLEVLRKVN